MILRPARQIVSKIGGQPFFFFISFFSIPCQKDLSIIIFIIFMQFAWHLFWIYSYDDMMQCTTTHILHLPCILFFCHDLSRCHRASSDLVACCFFSIFHVESPQCAFSFPYLFSWCVVLLSWSRSSFFVLRPFGFAGFFPSGLTDWTSRRNVIGDFYNLFLFYSCSVG